MTAQDQDPARANRRRRNRNLGSSLIFAALAVALVAIALMYLQEDNGPPATAPIPRATPGENILINVSEAVEAQGLKPTFGPGTVRVAELVPPGQLIVLGDARLYVFLFGSTEEQQDASQELDPTTLTLLTPSGTPVAGVGSPLPDLHVTAGSNVIAILVGGTPEQIEKVDAAIASLP
jgi:hypothetical protein